MNAPYTAVDDGAGATLAYSSVSHYIPSFTANKARRKCIFYCLVLLFVLVLAVLGGLFLSSSGALIRAEYSLKHRLSSKTLQVYDVRSIENRIAAIEVEVDIILLKFPTIVALVDYHQSTRIFFVDLTSSTRTRRVLLHSISFDYNDNGAVDYIIASTDWSSTLIQSPHACIKREHEELLVLYYTNLFASLDVRCEIISFDLLMSFNEYKVDLKVFRGDYAVTTSFIVTFSECNNLLLLKKAANTLSNYLTTKEVPVHYIDSMESKMKALESVVSHEIDDSISFSVTTSDVEEFEVELGLGTAGYTILVKPVFVDSEEIIEVRSIVEVMNTTTISELLVDDFAQDIVSQHIVEWLTTHFPAFHVLFTVVVVQEDSADVQVSLEGAVLVSTLAINSFKLSEDGMALVCMTNVLESFVDNRLCDKREDEMAQHYKSLLETVLKNSCSKANDAALTVFFNKDSVIGQLSMGKVSRSIPLKDVTLNHCDFFQYGFMAEDFLNDDCLFGFSPEAVPMLFKKTAQEQLTNVVVADVLRLLPGLPAGFSLEPKETIKKWKNSVVFYPWYKRIRWNPRKVGLPFWKPNTDEQLPMCLVDFQKQNVLRLEHKISAISMDIYLPMEANVHPNKPSDEIAADIFLGCFIGLPFAVIVGIGSIILFYSYFEGMDVFSTIDSSTLLLFSTIIATVDALYFVLFYWWRHLSILAVLAVCFLLLFSIKFFWFIVSMCKKGNKKSTEKSSFAVVKEQLLVSLFAAYAICLLLRVATVPFNITVFNVCRQT
ncbi:hypothetical protein RCL1_006597 [Eukaryota sp. TZLM3-RCL]